MAIAVFKKVFSKQVCYNFWCNTLKTLQEDSQPVIDEACREHNSDRRYDELIALNRLWCGPAAKRHQLWLSALETRLSRAMINQTYAILGGLAAMVAVGGGIATDIPACVQELERRGLTVLSGVMHALQDRLPDWKVAIISVTPKLTDPGAPKRRYVMVDRRVFALPCCSPDEEGPS
jgi:hypothetical protein